MRGIIGVVHLPPLPGDPLHDGAAGFQEPMARALTDARALVAGGVDALLAENFGSVPFWKGTGEQRTPPHHVAALALVARRLAEETGVPVGVNCLRCDAMASLGIAAAAELSFIRVNVHTGVYVTDQGIIAGEAARTLRYRRALGATGVAILADVQVKHAAPLRPVDLPRAVEDCIQRGLADGIIVTGEATGDEVVPARLREAREAAGTTPVYLGSGVTPAMDPALLALADGAIVGTWCKQAGEVRAPVELARVHELVAAVRPHLRPSESA